MTIFCPRCGSENTETTKYCRQCGLPVNQVSHYVASGGTAPLGSRPAPGALSGFTPLQQLVFTIMFFLFFPGLLGMIGATIGFPEIAAVGGMLVPFGILWAVFRYRNEKRRLQQQAVQQQQIPPYQSPAQMPPVTARQQPYQPQISPPPTNPLATPSQGSITEDETQRFPGQNR